MGNKFSLLLILLLVPLVSSAYFGYDEYTNDFGYTNIERVSNVSGGGTTTNNYYNNYTLTIKGNPPYLYNDSDTMYFNETKLNATIDDRASGLGDNSSWNQSLANSLYIAQSDEGNLDVNSADFWDALDSPADITGLLMSQISDIWATVVQSLTATNSYIILNDSTDNIEISFNETRLNDTIDSKLATTTYIPTSIATIFGTNTYGNLGNITVMNDGYNYTVQEATGGDALEVRINFTNVESFNYGITRVWYAGGAGHYIDICLWNYNTVSWDCAWTISISTTYEIITGTVFGSENYIGTGGDAGIVQVKYDHVGNGNTNHYLYIDYIAISDGISTITSNEHDALSGRNNILTNHPNIGTIFYNKTQIDSFGYINSTNVAYINNTNTYTKLQNFTANISVGRFKFYDNGTDLIIE